MTARDYLAAVQQRADDPRAKYHHKPCSAPVCGSRHCQTARDRDALLAALTAVLDLHTRGECYPPAGYDGTVPTDDDRIDDACQHCEVEWPCPTVAVITDALTPKENDS